MMVTYGQSEEEIVSFLLSRSSPSKGARFFTCAIWRSIAGCSTGMVHFLGALLIGESE